MSAGRGMPKAPVLTATHGTTQDTRAEGSRWSSLNEHLLNPWEVNTTPYPQVQVSNRQKITAPGLKEGPAVQTSEAWTQSQLCGPLSFLGLGLDGVRITLSWDLQWVPGAEGKHRQRLSLCPGGVALSATVRVQPRRADSVNAPPCLPSLPRVWHLSNQPLSTQLAIWRFLFQHGFLCQSLAC